MRSRSNWCMLIVSDGLTRSCIYFQINNRSAVDAPFSDKERSQSAVVMGEMQMG
jgi:hypothetical protein